MDAKDACSLFGTLTLALDLNSHAVHDVQQPLRLDGPAHQVFGIAIGLGAGAILVRPFAGDLQLALGQRLLLASLLFGGALIPASPGVARAAA